MTKRMTPQERANVARAREIDRIETTHEDRFRHYSEGERDLILAVFLMLPRLGKTSMDAAIARLIRRNFIACEPKVGWQEAARNLLDRTGKARP